MKKQYPVITLCGSTRFKKEFEEVQKDLTLNGYIVISVGLFGHSGDDEVWEGMDERTKTQTKIMLDDMHKNKIDMADEIYVINPDRYIGESTWSEICYARMVGKQISFLEPTSLEVVDAMVEEHLSIAEEMAWKQYDFIVHCQPYYNEDDMVSFLQKKERIYDPWVTDDSTLINKEGFPWHGDRRLGHDPFCIYGKEKMAKFVETMVMKNKEYVR